MTFKPIGIFLKIAMFTRGLSNVMGGMERQLLSIASGFINEGHDVTIISLDSDKGKPFFEADPRLVFIGLSIGNSSTKASLQERFLRQKKVFQLLGHLESDIAIAFMTGSFWFSAIPAKLQKIPIILAERNGPSIYTKTRIRRFRFLVFATMVLADVITVQFDSYKKRYPFFLRRRIVAIPNKIPIFPKSKQEFMDQFIFLFAGRLSNQKQINELAMAFVEFNKEHSDTRLEIFGEGEQFNRLKEIIQSNKAESFITLHPPTKNIFHAMTRAHVMVAPSLWEGFPNSVAEALACGLPVGGFEDCEGVRDLVIDGVNGWITNRKEPVKSQVELLQKIYQARLEINSFSEAAVRSVAKYQGEEPNEKWNHLVQTLLLK
jgi:GalNAc-alpha-(1->4)-GalNAc-alpha-(1->3)-diNAcBac-PP-undecaprenol alpha-1,4-N-acetyl-D-galactosaminyltransferase